MAYSNEWKRRLRILNFVSELGFEWLQELLNVKVLFSSRELKLLLGTFSIDFRRKYNAYHQHSHFPCVAITNKSSVTIRPFEQFL